eukprot:2587318-Pyramimonas_sp.AAC.1
MPPEVPKRDPRKPWETPNKATGGPQEDPSWLQKTSGGPQLLKTAQEGPKTAREGPRTAQKSSKNARTAFYYEVHRTDPTSLVPRLRLE